MNITNHLSDSQSYVIASTYRRHQHNKTNIDRHNGAVESFKTLNVPFKVVEGGYRHDSGEYITEQSLLFPAEHWNTFVYLFFRQESILILGTLGRTNKRPVTLRFLRASAAAVKPYYLGQSCDDLVSLGHFSSVSRETALANEAGYTRDQDSYYIAA